MDLKNSDHRPVVGIYKCYLKDSQNVENSLNTVFKADPQEIKFQKQSLFDFCSKDVVLSNDSSTPICIDKAESDDGCIWASESRFNIIRHKDFKIKINCNLGLDDFKECENSYIKTVDLLLKYEDESNFITSELIIFFIFHHF